MIEKQTSAFGPTGDLHSGRGQERHRIHGGSSVSCVGAWISPSSEGAAPEQTLQVEQLTECEQHGPTKIMPVFTGATTLSGQAGLGHGDPKKCASQTMKTWKPLSWQCKFYEIKYLSNC